MAACTIAIKETKHLWQLKNMGVSCPFSKILYPNILKILRKNARSL
jgi:serine/threonine-protein kinase RIO1